MGSKITIKLSSAEDNTQALPEAGLPVDFSATAELKYTQARVGEGLSIRQWLMPGLCILYEDPAGYEGPLPDLTISGHHVSIVCYGSVPIQNVPEGSSPLSGTIEVRNAQVTSAPGSAGREKRVFIIFSRPFLSKLLQDESWIRDHELYGLFEPASEKCYRYFLELPVRQILNALINEDLEPSQKKYYFELKLKELFFLLHLQSGITGAESTIPVEIQEKLNSARAYLLANYAAAPTIKQLSRIVSLNEFWLKQLFKARFGTTIRSYVTALRMEEARNLLLSNRSVSEVAARLGYRNVSHFILVFKRTFGDTPRQVMYKHDPGRDPVRTQHDVAASI